MVKMDATANDVPSLFEVRGFPTLFWLPKNSKSKPVKYEVSLIQEVLNLLTLVLLFLVATHFSRSTLNSKHSRKNSATLIPN